MRERTEKQHKQHRVKKSIRLFCLTAVVLLFAAGGTAVVRAALESDKSTSVRSVHMQDARIENSTIIIGSHLIHISALTDELYQVALDSANDFNQTQMYYKSELADGTWFEISEATSIADITTSGTPVSKSVIENLEFTHQTKSDGITIDLRTGSAVSVFDISNPYDLRTMEELEPLRIQYQILQEKTDKNESDRIYLSMVGALFDKDIQNDATKSCDASLQALGNYKNGLSSRNKPSQWTQKTEDIMTAVDAERRVISLTNLENYLDALENDASGMGASNQKQNSDGETIPADFVVNSEIVSAIGDSISNVQESISSYEAKRMSASGESVSADMEYQYSQELISKAGSGDTAGCDSIMEKLCNLQNILDGVIVQQDSELATLTSDLVSAAFTKYTSDLRAGVNEEYRTAVGEGAAKSVLQKYLSQQKTAANADRMEYQSMLEAQFKRMDNAAAQTYVLRLIDGVAQLENSVLKDDAAPYLLDTVAAHLIWLRKSYGDLVKNASDATEMVKLEQEKDALEKQRQDALDKNDLAEAKKLTAQMEAKQKDIDDLASRLNAILNSPSSSESDKARAAAGLGEKNVASRIASMADDLTEAIRNADDETSPVDLQNQLTALAAAATLDPSAGQAALSQVQDALDNAAGLSADAADALGAALSDAMDAIAGAGSKDLTADALGSLLDSILNGMFGNGGFDSVTSGQQAAAMIAMEWYGQEKGSSAALDLAASLAKQTAQEKNPYIYDKYTGKTDAYISLQALGGVLGYRYIFNDSHNTVTLQKAKEYYLFTLAQKQYETTGGSEKELTAAPEQMQGLYLNGADSEALFDTKAENFEKAAYGAVGTPTVETIAEQIYEQLLEGGA